MFINFARVGSLRGVTLTGNWSACNKNIIYYCDNNNDNSDNRHYSNDNNNDNNIDNNDNNGNNRNWSAAFLDHILPQVPERFSGDFRRFLLVLLRKAVFSHLLA